MSHTAFLHTGIVFICQLYSEVMLHSFKTPGQSWAGSGGPSVSVWQEVIRS